MSYPTGKVQLYDADGVLITTLDLDENGEATYTKTLTQEDVGRDTFRAVYAGDNTFAGRGEDTFTVEVVDADGNGGTRSKALGVTKIVAGPGIYISPNSGKGEVTISTRPIADAGTEDFYRIRWTQSSSADTKVGTDLSMFVAGGNDGLLMTSDDGQSWVDTGPKNTLGVGKSTVPIENLTVIQNSAFPGDGLIYYTVADGRKTDGGSILDYIGVAWGALGYTNASSVYTGDNIDKQSSSISTSGVDLTERNIRYSETFVLGTGYLALVFSDGGYIWSASQILTDLTTTFGGPNAILTEESTSAGEVITCSSSHLEDGTGSFTLKAVNSQGNILTSSRSGTSPGSWSVEYSGGTRLNGISYGNGRWVATGNGGKLLVNSGSGWSLVASGTTANLNACKYGNGRWVICGGTGVLLISDDDGATWSISDSGTKGDLYDIEYSPTLKVFAAVGQRRYSVVIKGY
jgi:hypothetical protein